MQSAVAYSPNCPYYIVNPTSPFDLTSVAFKEFVDHAKEYVGLAEIVNVPCVIGWKKIPTLAYSLRPLKPGVCDDAALALI
jgi:hypothetical protein